MSAGPAGATRPKHLVPIALGAILLVAAALRVFGLNWDDGHHLHPDERFLAIVGDKIRFPSDPLTYFDTRRSPLNPYNQGFDGFAYGTLPLFVTRAIAALAGLATYDSIHLVGRALSALADVGTVALVFLLGRLVYGYRVGLAAAALTAFAVIHIQLSHFFAVDTFLTFATTLALYAAYRSWLHGRPFDYALLGLALGIAAATKLSAALLVPIVGLVLVVPRPTGGTPPISTRAAGALICGLTALLVYRVGEPYSFTSSGFFGLRPNEQRFSDLDRWVKISSGEIEVPFMIQWAGTPNPWFALRSIVEWGLGPPAGLAAFAGLGLAAFQLTRWPRNGQHLLLVAWSAINLAYFGFQFAKFLRYLLPVYPALAVLAGYILVQLAGPMALEVNRRARRLCRAALPAVLVATALYGLMFTAIYSRPHTRVEASRWMYENVPNGAALAVEHWDDALPLRLPGRDKSFVEVSMPLYDEESPEKARKLVDNLRRADFVILSSDRLIGSINRMPRRFPLAVEYYRLLLSGELGFELVAKFDSRPSLLWLEIDDSSAQEDFSVYDHPTVRVFRKSPTFSGDRVSQMLGAVPLDNIDRTKPVELGARSGLLLSPSELSQVEASGTWSELFSLDGLASNLPVVVWLLAVEALAVAVLPLCWWLFPGLADRGYGVAKIVGLLGVTHLAWLVASVGIASFGRGLVFVSLLIVAATCTVIFRQRWRQIATDLSSRRRVLIRSELVFVAAFGLMLGIRMLNPDLWHPSYGGEKPMDFAYLNAIVKTPSFPPYDPWFAGGYINYYYYGFVLVATLVHLSSVPPAQAYNLAIATVFALTAVGAFSFGLSITARRTFWRQRDVLRRATVAGLVSAVALLLLGNLDGAVQLRDALWRNGGEGISSVLPLVTGLSRAAVGVVRALGGAALPGFDFWRSTRFIGPEDPGPIHEFPFFTFLYGDLHAHMISMPLQVLAVVIGLQLVRCDRPSLEAWWTRIRSFGRDRSAPVDTRPLVILLLGALLVGSLRATNTWDFPTYLLLLAGAAALLAGPSERLGWVAGAFAGGAAAVGLYTVSSALFLPYLARYELFYTGVVPVKAVTDVLQFLTINGLLLALVGGWLTIALVRAWSTAFGGGGRGMMPSGGYLGVAIPWIGVGIDTRAGSLATIVLAAVLALTFAGRGLFGVVLALAAAAGIIAALRQRARETLYLLLVAAAALGALVLPELVAVRGDVGRMNTVFKFYLQAWILLALLAGPATLVVVRRLIGELRRRNAWAGAALALLALLVLCATIYPLRATPTKLGLRMVNTEPTLDGMAFMARASHSENRRDLNLPGDHAAIRWMLETIEGTPVILEGQAPLYHWGSRFSIYTGLPAVLGWDWHQKQQRWGYQNQVDERARDVKAAYETTSSDVAMSILRKYDVSYVVVGGLERAYYPPAGLDKFESMVGRGLEIAYRAGDVTIYRVTES